jgi:2-oxo-4-hydroxy-4-carboxy-5-ureidoimidazoline decarboxylase
MTRPAQASAALAAFNAAPPAEAERDLLRCCGSPAFAAAMAAGRPYSRTEELSAAVDAEFRSLDWTDLTQALAAHPRIGEPGRSNWSRAEQAAAGTGDAGLAQALAEGNRAYEDRFGHVFLICATGLSAAQILTSLQARLAHDPSAERTTVREELRKITQLRLGKLLAE